MRCEVRDGATTVAQWRDGDIRPGLTVKPLVWPIVMVGDFPYQVKAEKLVYYEDGEAIFDMGRETTITLGGR
jgi:hypothetical protein